MSFPSIAPSISGVLLFPFDRLKADHYLAEGSKWLNYQGVSWPTVAHVDLDAFYVGVERVLNPALCGIPVIVGGDPATGRGVVACASYEARKFGVKSAMPLQTARRLCPQAKVVKASFQEYSGFSKRVFSILEECAPVVEGCSIDEAYLDLSGLEALQKGPIITLVTVRKRVLSEIGISLSFGLAASRMAAKIIGDHFKPACGSVILPGRDGEVLSRLKIERVPGVGPKALDQLHYYRIFTIGDALQFPESAALVLGDPDDWVPRFEGRGASHVGDDSVRKGISCETTLMTTEESLDRAREILWRLVEDLGSQLRQAKVVSVCLGVKVRRSDRRPESRQVTLTAGTNDDREIFKRVWPLLEVLLTTEGVRLVGVRATHLTNSGSFEPDQLRLFGPTAEDAKAQRGNDLSRTKDLIRDKFGWDSIRVAGSEVEKEEDI